MIKRIFIILLIYFILLIPLFTYMQFSRAFTSNDLWLQITREGGIPYTVMDELEEHLPMEYFEYAISYDYPGQVSYNGEMINTTLRVWKEYIADKRINDALNLHMQISPFFAKGNTGLFLYPLIANSQNPSSGEITINGKNILLKGKYAVEGLPMHGDFYLSANELGLLTHSKSTTFLPDDLILAYYNEQNTTNIQSLEELKYDTLLIRISYNYLPTKKELNQFIDTLENEGYDVYRPVQQNEIVWRNNRIFYFVTVTSIMSGTVTFLLIRRKRKHAA